MIVTAIRTAHPELWVPRWVQGMTKATGVLPRWLQERIAGAFGADRRFLLGDFLARDESAAYARDGSFLVIRAGHRALLLSGIMAYGSALLWALFLALRWLSGIVGVLGLAWLTWQTLKIPNTQSATGILYAGVILVFIGELTSQLLSAQALYPV